MKETWQRHGRSILLFVLIALVSTVSFGLGYLSALDSRQVPIVIEQK